MGFLQDGGGNFLKGVQIKRTPHTVPASALHICMCNLWDFFFWGGGVVEGAGVQNKAGQSRLSLTAHCHLFQRGETNNQTNKQTKKQML